MSGISTSITSVMPDNDADAALAVIETGRAPHDPGIAWLHVTSRNNHLEYNLRALLEEFHHDGLSYFQAWDEIINHKPWGVVLRGESLQRAIVGLQHFFSTFWAEPEKVISVWNDKCSYCTEEEVAELLNSPWPDTLEQAKEWSDRRDPDREYIEDAMAFLHAHLHMLRFAEEKGMSALYAVWLY